jgi:glycosyltransferase involved in cell wall biosynthesis/Tfp pilus assembly protein PilF
VRNNGKNGHKKGGKGTSLLDADICMAQTLLAKGQPDQARIYAQRAHKTAPEITETLLLLATAELARGEHAVAERLLDQVLEKEPENAGALTQLGTIYYQRGDSGQAIAVLERAAVLRPGHAETLNDLGVLWSEAGDSRKAAEYLAAALDADPDHLDACYNAAVLAFQSHDDDRASDLFEKLVRLAPNHADVRLHLGYVRERQGDIRAAADCFRKAAEIQPADGSALYSLGTCLYRLADYESAVDAFRSCVDEVEEASDARLGLAMSLIRMERAEEALEVWDDFPGTLPKFMTHRDPVAPRLRPSGIIEPFTIMDANGNGSSDCDTVGLSVVIPMYNEEGNVDILYNKLTGVMKSLDRSYEIVFVDDGSTDRTFTVLTGIAKKDPAVKVLSFRRNYGQTAAISAGFDYARGEVVVTMDGDLQNDPEDIPKMLDKLAEGYDLVSGWREKRQDHLWRRKIPSIVANRLIAKITGVQLHDYGCTLKAYKRGVVKNIRLYGEMHRFIPAIASWLGVKTVELPVRHHPRQYGKTKYGLTRVVRVVLDLINVKFLTSYSTRPMQYFGKLGIYLMVAACFAAVVMIGAGVSFDTVFLASMLIGLMAVQFVTMGVLAEIIVRTYHESQDKPIYVIKEIIE